MRVFVVFLFVTGGMVIATQSSAQDLMPIPQHTEADVFKGAPFRHRICGSGTLHRGGFSGQGGVGCGCGEDGNCSCQGSYKYPVPSQSTYFWPGIYSQQTLTQYASPWRYPDLNPIPESWKLDPTEDKSPFSGHKY